jgi:hypothetical protein
MNLTEAKEICKSLLGETFSTIVERGDYHLIPEEIRIVCSAACNGDEEANVVQGCIPEEMQYIGLYHNTMKMYNPEIADKVTKEGRKVLDELLEKRKIDKHNTDKI